MNEKKMLNFRCPMELLDEIDAMGRERYPANNDNGCDRSKTLMDIIRAGIQALNEGTVVLPVLQEVRQESEIEAVVKKLQEQVHQLSHRLEMMEVNQMGEFSA